jgi:spore maturation protein CgeB
MRIVLFCHSLLSDWNHGNAHFLRGVVTELAKRGHSVRAFEPRDAWSAKNLVRDHGEDALRLALDAYPHVRPRRYDPATFDLDDAVEGADLVLAHEWNDAGLVRRLGERRKRGAAFTLLFHDTHHRSVTDEAAMAAYDLSGYDGVLAFGAGVREVYLQRGWARRAWVWHEAADVRVFHPMQGASRDGDVVWIGNWGDDERTEELRELFLVPVKDLGLRARAYGVRYPTQALATLREHGVVFGGWLPNSRAPHVYARHAMTVHVPRRPYVRALPGVPTIRVFEALACGVPLVSGPWDDVEGLFVPGLDYLVANDGDAMRRHMRALLADEAMARELAAHGRETILARHTCAHRVDELLAICDSLGTGRERTAPEPPTQGPVP